MLIYIITGIVILIFFTLLRYNKWNFRNGLFGKKIRIFLKDKDTQNYIVSSPNEIRLFYGGVTKKVSSFGDGIPIWIPRNSVLDLVIIEDKNIIVRKINSAIETEKIVEI